MTPKNKVLANFRLANTCFRLLIIIITCYNVSAHDLHSDAQIMSNHRFASLHMYSYHIYVEWVTSLVLGLKCSLPLLENLVHLFPYLPMQNAMTTLQIILVYPSLTENRVPYG